MILRLELLGRVFYVEWLKAQEPEPEEAQERPPVDVPQPMVVYPDPPAEPLGFHAGGLEQCSAP